MRARIHGGLIAGITAIAGLMTGCVSTTEHDRANDTIRSLESQNADLRARLDSSGQQLGSMRDQGNSANTTISGLQTENRMLLGKLQDASDSLENMEDRLASLNFVSLDAATNLALARLANEHPGMITYDADRAMLRFSSDLTFRSGSDEVKPDAAMSLNALADVLNTAAAQGYDLQVVGHTDNEKISSNTAKYHPTNMHLASHRAIAVRKQLGQKSVGWDRMSVVGWAEHRPVVMNNPTGGTSANRRVEIFVVPSTRGNINTLGTTNANVDVDRQRPPAQIDPTK